MSTLQQEPFSLTIGQPIKMKLVTVNSVGDSVESLPSGEAVSA